MTIVPKKFDSVSLEAKATASPTTPAPVSSMVMLKLKMLCPMNSTVIKIRKIFSSLRTISTINGSILSPPFPA